MTDEIRTRIEHDGVEEGRVLVNVRNNRFATVVKHDKKKKVSHLEDKETGKVEQVPFDQLPASWAWTPAKAE